MVTVAGVDVPCLDCRLLDRLCRQRDEIMRKVFFSIGNKKPVICTTHEVEKYHGLEDVRP